MQGRVFGRLLRPDVRDGSFPMSAVLAGAAGEVKTRIWRTGPILDQGDKPHCVAFAWKQYLQCSPLRQGAFLHPDFVYELAQERDDWPGQEYDGTSVRAGAKVLQRIGFIESYRWATSANDVRNWLINRGPVVLGSNWYECMSNPDKKGILDFSKKGENYGGHAYICIGWDEKKKLFKFANSWSTEWGVKGCFYMKSEDFEHVLKKEDGEACAAVERKV
jgi:hypothetical protein